MRAGRLATRLFSAAAAMILAGVAVGLASGLASRTLHVIGLYEVAAGLSLAFIAVACAHLLQIRSRWSLIGLATVTAIAWLVAHHGAEAWLFRWEQVGAIDTHGLLLADHAVLHDSDDPEELTDAALLAETGADGIIGAARLLLQRGLRIQAVAGRVRVVPLPLWAHALFYALQAALIAIWLSRALAHLAEEPVCSRCGAWLRRRRLGYLDEGQALELAQSWRQGDRITPIAETTSPRGSRRVLVLEDRCPEGHSVTPGYEIRRRRRLSLAGRRPGPMGRIPALSDVADSHADNGTQ